MHFISLCWVTWWPQRRCGSRTSHSHWTRGVAGLISRSSCSALHLLTSRVTPADPLPAQTPSITPPDAPPSFTGRTRGEFDKWRLWWYHSSVIRCSGSRQQKWRLFELKHHLLILRQNKISTFWTGATKPALRALHSHVTDDDMFVVMHRSQSKKRMMSRRISFSLLEEGMFNYAANTETGCWSFQQLI